MNRSRRRGSLVAAATLLCALGAPARAQSVGYSGMLGDKALLVINGQPRSVAVGSTVEGVRLVRLDGQQAQVEAGGKLQSLRLGGAAQVAGADRVAGGSRIVLPAGPGGHFSGLAAINGHPVRFVVDTGATVVAMGADVASQLGLDASAGTAMGAMTANGVVAVRRVMLGKLTVGEVTLYNVEAAIVPQPMPEILLGNSFLSHFRMRSDGGSLTLDRMN